MKLWMLSLTVAVLCGGAYAATPTTPAWPTKPVRVVVGFGAGGTLDVLARYVTEKLAKYNGQAFVIDNRPGAGGNIGAGIGARANADGYQLLFTPGSVLTMNPSLYSQMPLTQSLSRRCRCSRTWPYCWSCIQSTPQET